MQKEIPKVRDVRNLRRGRGLILRGNEVLLCNRIGVDYWYLPGGKADMKEFACAALCREIKEEIGLHSVIDEFVGVFEHEFFDVRRNVHVQEVNFIFTLSFSDDLPESVESREPHLQFKWRKIEIAEGFYPSALFPLLHEWFKERKPFYGKSHGAPKQ